MYRSLIGMSVQTPKQAHAAPELATFLKDKGAEVGVMPSMGFKALQDRARPVTFRPLRAEDKELFASFLRSLPRKDNYYLLVDVSNDQTIERWMDKVKSGQTIGVVAMADDRMVGYGNLKINDLPWTRHVGEIRISVSTPYRGRGVGKALTEQMFSVARARGLRKVWARMAISQGAAQHMLMKLGFRTEAVLSDFVMNKNGVTEDLVIMSHDSGKSWSS